MPTTSNSVSSFRWSTPGTYLQHLVVIPPPALMNSSQIEEQLAPIYQRLNFHTGRFEELTGVTSRGYWPLELKPSDIGAIAAQRCLTELKEQVGFLPEQLDAVINCSVCRDGMEPSTASRIHSLLNLPGHCEFFDVSNACLGLINGISVASGLIKMGHRQVLLVVNENPLGLWEETLRHLLSIAESGQLNGEGFAVLKQQLKQHLASLTLGGASIALMLGAEPLPGSAFSVKAERLFHWTDSSANGLCYSEGDYRRVLMHTQSAPLMEKGVALAQQLWRNRASAPAVNLDSCIFHQVGKGHHQMLWKALELGTLPTTLTYPTWGNTGPASLGVTWDAHLREQVLPDLASKPKGQQSHRCLWMGIGSGLMASFLEVEVRRA